MGQVTPPAPSGFSLSQYSKSIVGALGAAAITVTQIASGNPNWTAVIIAWAAVFGIYFAPNTPL